MFNGWQAPESNYFRIPNEFTNLLAEMTSLAEAKVVIYILRHTWGFQEYEGFKTITRDEFQHGRKTRAGRMDKGVGMSQTSIVDGLKRAVEHGYIEILIDKTDPARIKKQYRLTHSNGPTEAVGPDQQNLQSRPTEAVGRTTLERNLRKKHSQAAASRRQDDPSPSGGFKIKEDAAKPDLDAADELARQLYSGLAAKDKIMRKPSMVVWGAEFRKFIKAADRVTVAEMIDVVTWYCAAVGGDYVPQAYAAKSFCDKYVKIRDMMRSDVAEVASMEPAIRAPSVEMTYEERVKSAIDGDMNDCGCDDDREGREEYRVWCETYRDEKGEDWTIERDGIVIKPFPEDGFDVLSKHLGQLTDEVEA